MGTLWNEDDESAINGSAWSLEVSVLIFLISFEYILTIYKTEYIVLCNDYTPTTFSRFIWRYNFLKEIDFAMINLYRAH